MMLISFPAGLYTVFGTTLSKNVTAATVISGVNYNFVFATVELPIGGTLGGVFLGFSAIYLIFLIATARQGVGIARAIRGTVPDDYDSLFRNPLAAVVLLLGATSFVTLVLDTLQTNAGISTGSLSGDPFSLLLNFTLAPLLEETSFRAVMLGVPILILSLIMFRELSPVKIARTIWRPSYAWDVDEVDGVETVHTFQDGGPWLFPEGSDSLKARAIRPVVYTFLILSSLIFGYAHYAAGSGWGPGKISEAALAGLALGYLYVKYGFAACVLLHWSVDYVGSVFSFLAQAVYGVPWSSNTGNYLDVIPNLLVIFLLGLPSTYIVAKEILKRRSKAVAAPAVSISR